MISKEGVGNWREESWKTDLFPWLAAGPHLVVFRLFLGNAPNPHNLPSPKCSSHSPPSPAGLAVLGRGGCGIPEILRDFPELCWAALGVPQPPCWGPSPPFSLVLPQDLPPGEKSSFSNRSMDCPGRKGVGR